MILSHFVWEVTTAHDLTFDIGFLFLQMVCTQVHLESPFLSTKIIMSCVLFSNLFLASHLLPQVMWKFLKPQGHSGTAL